MKVHRRAKLAASQVREIRTRAAAGQSQTSLSHEYGVSQPCISQIVHRDTWRHIDPDAPPPTLADWKRWSTVIAGRDPADCEAALFVFAALDLHCDPEAVSRETGIAIERCRIYAERLYENGIFVDGKWYADETFLRDDAATQIEIALWTLVVQGEVISVSGRERMEEREREREKRKRGE